MAALLLGKGAEVDSLGEHGWTAIHQAVMSGHESMIKLLLDRGALVAPQDIEHRTALHWAAMYGGVDIAIGDDSQRMVLHWAALRGHESVVKLFLEYGADTSALYDTWMTSLLMAAMNGREVTPR